MKSILFLLIFIFSFRSMAIDTICYDEKNAFLFESSNGWLLDAIAADKAGLCAVYVLKGFTFDNSPVVIYPRLITSSDSLKVIIEKDKADYMKKSLSAFIEKKKKFKSKKNKFEFEVLSFNNGQSPNEYELVFYHKVKNAVLLLVLSARNSNDLKTYKKDLEAFANLVKTVNKKK